MYNTLLSKYTNTASKKVRTYGFSIIPLSDKYNACDPEICSLFKIKL